MAAAPAENTGVIRVALRDALSELIGIQPLIELIAEYLILIPITLGAVSGSGIDGCADGKPFDSAFSFPQWSVMWKAADACAPVLLVTDYRNNRIRSIDLSDYSVSSFALEFGKTNTFHRPTGLAVEPATNALLVVECSHNFVSRLGGNGTRPALVCGLSDYRGGWCDGVGGDARFSYPHAIVVTADSEFGYLADLSNDCIRRIALETGAVTTVAGSRLSDNADSPQALTGSIRQPRSLAFAYGDESILYITSVTDLRRWNMKTDALDTIPIPREFGCASGIAALSRHLLIVATSTGAIVTVDTRTGHTSSALIPEAAIAAAGDGSLRHQLCTQPLGLLFVAGSGANAGVDELYVCNQLKHNIVLMKGSIAAKAALAHEP